MDKYTVEQLFPTVEQLASWRVDRSDGETRLSGRCFHCGHACLVEVQERVLLGGVPASLDADGGKLEAIPRQVLCNCEQTHPERPPEVLAGCGRFWMGMIRERPDHSWFIEPLTDTTLYPALRLLSDDERTQDDRMRNAAEKWITAVTALCGLFSVAGLVVAKDALAGIATSGRVAVALVYVGALATAAIALVTGYTAAYGWPSEQDTTTVEQVRSYYRQRREGPRSAVRRLRRSVILACTTLGLLSTMVLLLWFLPRGGTLSTPPAGGATAPPIATSSP